MTRNSIWESQSRKETFQLETQSTILCGCEHIDWVYLFLTMDSVELKIWKGCQLNTNVSKFDKFARISPLILGFFYAVFRFFSP